MRALAEFIMRGRIQATLVVVSVNVLLVNFLVDLLYAALDPRIRLQAGN